MRVLNDERIAWAVLAAWLDGLDDDLERDARAISRARSQLETLEQEWAETLEAAAERDDPPVVRREVREALDDIARNHDLLNRRLDPMLDAQARLGVLRRDVNDALERIDERVTVFGRDVLRPENPPVWRALDTEAFSQSHAVPIRLINDVMRLLQEAGLAGEAVKATLRRVTDEAIARGVFGSPFLLVDGEPFWGNDRLEQVDEWLARGGW